MLLGYLGRFGQQVDTMCAFSQLSVKEGAVRVDRGLEPGSPRW